jgi:acetyl esterase/lipase
MTLLARTFVWLVVFGAMCVVAGSSAQWWETNVRSEQAEELETRNYFSVATPISHTVPVPTRQRETLTFRELPTGPLKVDIHTPSGVEIPSQGWPVIVSFHSGAWRGGHRAQVPIVELVEHGFAVVSPDFRSSDQAVFPAQLDDCTDLIDWLVANGKSHHLNVKSIGLFGASSGGHLALLTGLCDGRNPSIKAVCSLYAPSNFLTLEDGAGASDEMNHFAPWAPESLLLGGQIPERPEAAQLASPYWHAGRTENAPPILLMHGVDDLQVPFEQTLSLTRLLRQRQQPVTLWKVRSLEHGSWPNTRITSGVLSFFRRHLEGTTAPAERPQVASHLRNSFERRPQYPLPLPR